MEDEKNRLLEDEAREADNQGNDEGDNIDKEKEVEKTNDPNSDNEENSESGESDENEDFGDIDEGESSSEDAEHQKRFLDMNESITNSGNFTEFLQGQKGTQEGKSFKHCICFVMSSCASLLHMNTHKFSNQSIVKNQIS